MVGWEALDQHLLQRSPEVSEQDPAPVFRAGKISPNSEDSTLGFEHRACSPAPSLLPTIHVSLVYSREQACRTDIMAPHTAVVVVGAARLLAMTVRTLHAILETSTVIQTLADMAILETHMQLPTTLTRADTAIILHAGESARQFRHRGRGTTVGDPYREQRQTG